MNICHIKISILLPSIQQLAMYRIHISYAPLLRYCTFNANRKKKRFYQKKMAGRRKEKSTLNCNERDDKNNYEIQENRRKKMEKVLWQ